MVLQEKLKRLAKRYPVFHWPSSVDESHFMGFMDELKKIAREEGKRPAKLILYLNIQNGGELDIAWAFYDFFRLTKLHLITVASGDVASAGITVFLAGKERYASRFSSFLFHDPELRPDDGITIRNVEQIKERVLLMHDRYLDIISQATGLSREKVDELSLDASPITAERAKELGIVHDVF